MKNNEFTDLSMTEEDPSELNGDGWFAIGVGTGVIIGGAIWVLT